MAGSVDPSGETALTVQAIPRLYENSQGGTEVRWVISVENDLHL